MGVPGYMLKVRAALRAAIKEKGVAPTTLSQAVGNSKTLVSEILTKNADIRLSTLAKLADELGVPVERLIGVEVNQPAQWRPSEETISRLLAAGLGPLSQARVPSDDLPILAHAVATGLRLVADGHDTDVDEGYLRAAENATRSAIEDYKSQLAQQVLSS